MRQWDYAANRMHARCATWHFAVVLCLLPMSLWAREPEVMYAMECQGCHLADGSGGLNNIPTLRNSVAKFPAVAGGREYLVRVPGAALSSLSDQELSDVLNWMLRTFGPLESTRLYRAYTADEVAGLRRQPLTEISNTREQLMLRIAQLDADSAL
jgi:hypothetical protein